MRHSLSLLLIALFASVAPVQAMAASDIPDDVKVRCKADYSRLCSGIMPGGGRVLACFQAHKDRSLARLRRCALANEEITTVSRASAATAGARLTGVGQPSIPSDALEGNRAEA